MFLNEEFLTLWEELSELNESKADIQKLIDFAGEDLANRFLTIKSRLKAPENDLYYWIKQKSPEELEQAITKLEMTKSKTSLRKEAVKGGDLVYESEHWKVYHITTFEASQYYGRDTKWCITGINDWGDTFWNDYTKQGVKFYFLISKEKYDPRGNFSKIALAIYPNKLFEIFNQQDSPILFSDIPYCEEIKIPGLDIQNLVKNLRCYICGITLNEEDIWLDDRGEMYCEECFKKYYFKCAKCGRTVSVDDPYTIEDIAENKYCHNCESSIFTFDKNGYQYELKCDTIYVKGEAIGIPEVIRRLTNHLDQITTADKAKTTLYVLSAYTGDIIYYVRGLTGTDRTILADVEKALKEYEAVKLTEAARPGYYADRIFSILDDLSGDAIQEFLNSHIAWKDFDADSICDIYDSIGEYLETSSGQQLFGDLCNYFEIDEVTTESLYEGIVKVENSTNFSKEFKLYESL